MACSESTLIPSTLNHFFDVQIIFRFFLFLLMLQNKFLPREFRKHRERTKNRHTSCVFSPQTTYVQHKLEGLAVR